MPLDAFKPLDDLDPADLDALEATFVGQPTREPEPEPVADPEPEAKPAGRTRKGKQKPPRQKGEPVSEAALRAAQVGLPYFVKMNWMQVQLLDKGEKPTRGHVRYRLKIETCDAPVEHCTRAGLREMKKERWVMLSRPAAFLDNFDRKAKKYPLLHPGRECRPIVEELVQAAENANAADVPNGAPPSLCGFVQTRLQGTHTYGGQYCWLFWVPDRQGAWVPSALLTQFAPGPVGNWQHRTVTMKVPPAINRDGRPRNSPFTFVGSWFSPALQERIDTAKAIKQMRADHIAKTTGRRP